MSTLTKERVPLKDYQKLEATVMTLALTDPTQLMELLDRLVHEAYIAGINREEAGYYHDPRSEETIGQICVLADSWCKHKGTRP